MQLNGPDRFRFMPVFCSFGTSALLIDILEVLLGLLSCKQSTLLAVLHIFPLLFVSFLILSLDCFIYMSREVIAPIERVFHEEVTKEGWC